MAEKWVELGLLADLAYEEGDSAGRKKVNNLLKPLRNVVGFYRLIGENGKEVYLGRAVEFDNGGIAKRLRDYVRLSDSARQSEAGRAIHNRKDTLRVKYTIVGNNQAAKNLVCATEKEKIKQFKPELNVQHNWGNSRPLKKPSSSKRQQRNSQLDAGSPSARQIGKEAIETGVHAAAEALLEGTRSAVKNGLAYREGKIDGEQALMNVGKDAALSGGRIVAAGTLRVGVRHAASYLGTPMKSNIEIAAVAAIMKVGETIFDCVEGEISAEEAVERIGEIGCDVCGICVGQAAGAIFGPPGVVGYMAGIWIYQSCMAVLKHARLAEEEAVKLEALCAEAVQESNRRLREFEARMGRLLERREAGFNRCFAVIDKALEANETDDIVASLAQLVAMVGGTWKWESFEEHMQIMEQRPNARLVI